MTMIFFRITRHSVRSYSTITLLFCTICSSLFTIHLYRKNYYSHKSTQKIPIATSVQRQTSSSITATVGKTILTGIVPFCIRINELSKFYSFYKCAINSEDIIHLGAIRIVCIWPSFLLLFKSLRTLSHRFLWFNGIHTYFRRK